MLIVDVQEAFRTYIPRFGDLVAQLTVLVRVARLLGVPVACSEQYPRGLGATVAELAAELGDDAPPLVKVEFCACAAAGWHDLPPALRDARQIVVVGIEAHVCVRQTALELLRTGRDVHIPIDAVASREPQQRDVSVPGARTRGCARDDHGAGALRLARHGCGA